VTGRRWDARQGRGAGSLFSYVDLEQRIRPGHPLRLIRAIVNAARAEVSAEFDALYPPTGRDSIPPERRLRALLLQAFYSIRSERQLVERIDLDLLFRNGLGKEPKLCFMGHALRHHAGPGLSSRGVGPTVPMPARASQTPRRSSSNGWARSRISAASPSSPGGGSSNALRLGRAMPVARDHEATPNSAVAFFVLAAANILLRRTAKAIWRLC
jgi:hypothetical protein